MPATATPRQRACGNSRHRFAKRAERRFAMRETTGHQGHASPATCLRRRLTRQLPVLGLTVAVLTVLGPFGTFQDMGAAARLAYWGGLIAVGTLLFDLVMLAAQRVLADHARAWPLTLGAALLTVSLVQTLLVATLERELRRTSVAGSLGLMELYGYVLVVTLLVSALPIRLELRARGLLAHDPIGRAPAQGTAQPPFPLPAIPEPVGPELVGPELVGPEPVVESAPAVPATPPPSPFLDRIPPRLGRDLLALEMEDHYVRVHTGAGSDLVLMRLRDAIAALGGIDGLQVHRSYWVAAAAVDGVERKPDGKLTLRLRNGLRVPVSRSHVAAVRAAGWAGRGA